MSVLEVILKYKVISRNRELIVLFCKETVIMFADTDYESVFGDP